MTTPEHSPLPWRDDGFGIKDNSGESVCIYGFVGAGVDHAANRRLIVAAVNTRVDYAPLETKYAELIAAAKPFLERFPRIDDIKTLQAAIDKAEQAR